MGNNKKQNNMATEVRQVTRHQPPDWFTECYTQSTNAERQRSASHQVRQESRFLRNETDSQTKWDQYSNDVRLADRVDHIRKWKEILERTLGQLDQEIADLSEAKDETENALERKNLPTDVNIECLTLREGRKNIDVVQDEPENQLHKEAEVIDGIKKVLQQRIADSFEQLCLLQEARQQVQTDLQDKNIALGIDIDQYNLSDRSAQISYKPDALRVPKGSTTPQQWEDFSRYNKERAEAEMKSSNRLREQIHHTLQQTANDLDAQKQATEYAFRKRIHEFERAKDELEWQKKNTEAEIAELENGTYRPNVELCRDAPQYGLVDEVKQLYASKHALEEKLRQAQHALDGLQKTLHRLNDDIALKTNSLRLDNQCMGVRQRLNPAPQTEIEKNLNLTGIERMKSAILA